MARAGSLVEKVRQDWWKIIHVLGRPGGAAIDAGMQPAEPPPAESPHSQGEEGQVNRNWKTHGGGHV